VTGEFTYTEHVVEFCSCDTGEVRHPISEMVDPGRSREVDIAGGLGQLARMDVVERSLLVENGQLACHKVFDLDPHPEVFTVNTLLDLVQRFSGEHLVDVNIVAKESEEYVLGRSSAQEAWQGMVLMYRHISK